MPIKRRRARRFAAPCFAICLQPCLPRHSVCSDLQQSLAVYGRTVGSGQRTAGAATVIGHSARPQCAAQCAAGRAAGSARSAATGALPYSAPVAAAESSRLPCRNRLRRCCRRSWQWRTMAMCVRRRTRSGTGTGPGLACMSFYVAGLRDWVQAWMVSVRWHPRWEREIDWLALHGVNLPLVITGQECAYS